jgi:hypothetical protein
MTEHQASRAEHQGGATPPDRDALGLMEAIISEATRNLYASREGHVISLGVIADNATRLKALLADRDEAREELVAALEATLIGFEALVKVSGPPRNNDMSIRGYEEAHRRIAKGRAAVAAARGGA